MQDYGKYASKMRAAIYSALPYVLILHYPRYLPQNKSGGTGFPIPPIYRKRKSEQARLFTNSFLRTVTAPLLRFLSFYAGSPFGVLRTFHYTFERIFYAH